MRGALGPLLREGRFGRLERLEDGKVGKSLLREGCVSFVKDWLKRLKGWVDLFNLLRHCITNLS